ncbi:tRNA uridine-5-carboxymethylaminomethyl(34) synthesis GTPase MnmE [Qipengyuania sp. GH1]|uniref:tRNA uridine-5-carboxymethylaminomethyl(34) synthesis GTPase MnmE n=1 Tax=Qipengyuania aestuarii TaxID=2867241 RepID=UPI001C87255D|nr:tRNA uridine-5-carboxymethylaminomethyl(34) synthesis GTPase MnmE [Qipengyuania aestuarii]MBX7536568.1 tRNA uridine-5-carboxymethylaminomethyl(34) synthesis GTPase MnmE [Qipengyuania aestuarii]
MTDTIFALSSGAPPAAIGIIRISGPQACEAAERLAGLLPEERHAGLRSLRDGEGRVLDQCLLLWFAGPKTATGEDLVELHCHGGRAVVAAVENELASFAGLRRAQAGEFTRRAFANGVLDLAEAEGLGDLLSAETELQRRAAQEIAGGGLTRKVEEWRDRLLGLSALVEAQLDFSDEDDVSELPEVFHVKLSELLGEWERELRQPKMERLRDGIRVVLAGPPNAGKSSLFNAILQEGAAIVSAEAGTTRDVIERPIALDGVPFVLIDTAGLRDSDAGEIERIGIERARLQLSEADIVLWLGAEGEGPSGGFEVESFSDQASGSKQSPDFVVSSVTGSGIDNLISALVDRARDLLPQPGTATLNARQTAGLSDAHNALASLEGLTDALIVGEYLRLARLGLDRILGRNSTEDMLDSLFGRFCIGK